MNCLPGEIKMVEFSGDSWLIWFKLVAWPMVVSVSEVKEMGPIRYKYQHLWHQRNKALQRPSKALEDFFVKKIDSTLFYSPESVVSQLMKSGLDSQVIVDQLLVERVHLLWHWNHWFSPQIQGVWLKKAVHFDVGSHLAWSNLSSSLYNSEVDKKLIRVQAFLNSSEIKHLGCDFVELINLPVFMPLLSVVEKLLQTQPPNFKESAKKIIFHLLPLIEERMECSTKQKNARCRWEGN